MNAETQSALGRLNRSFYAARADEFSRTRDHPWPGWERVWGWVARAGALRSLPGALRILDVGCGNGRFGAFAAALAPVDYTGVDACAALLARAEQRHVAPRARFALADVVAEPPDRALPTGPFDLIVAFGLLHHIPARERRRALVGALGARLAPGGLLALTAWRFAEHARFEDRQVSWREYNAQSPELIDETELEPGDVLLRWGACKGPFPAGVRYCHAADDAELDELVAGTGLVVVDRFLADGREATLNRYLVLQRRDA